MIIPHVTFTGNYLEQSKLPGMDNSLRSLNLEAIVITFLDIHRLETKHLFCESYCKSLYHYKYQMEKSGRGGEGDIVLY